MAYWLEEYLETGERIKLGDPFFDLRIAKVIASQRALRVGRVIVVSDALAREIARYEPNGVPVASSVQRMRAGAVHLAPSSLSRKTSA